MQQYNNKVFALVVVATLMISSATILVEARQINKAGLDLIKSFEGFRANFYNDAVGIRTIGYGHACHASDCSKIHPPISVAQGETLLREDLTRFEACINKAFPNLDDDKFAALVSFAYNLGCSSATGSTLGTYVREKKYHAASGEFGKWVHAGGKVLAGLVRRRKAERDLFCKSGGC